MPGIDDIDLHDLIRDDDIDTDPTATEDEPGEGVEGPSRPATTAAVSLSRVAYNSPSSGELVVLDVGDPVSADEVADLREVEHPVLAHLEVG